MDIQRPDLETEVRLVLVRWSINTCVVSYSRRLMCIAASMPSRV